MEVSKRQLRSFSCARGRPALVILNFLEFPWATHQGAWPAAGAAGVGPVLPGGPIPRGRRMAVTAIHEHRACTPSPRITDLTAQG